MNFFDGKSILIISVKFFNYEELIKNELILAGAKVDLYDERPSNSFFSKAIIRIKKDLYTRKIQKHFRNIISEIKNNKYDFFLLIKGEATPYFFLEFLRANNPRIVLIYYTYDSFKNNPNGLGILKYFDRKFTFDQVDSKKHQLSFRPLFYAADYSHIKNEQKGFNYDLSFVGTAHSDRYNLSQKVTEWGRQNRLNFFNFYYSPSKILFRYKKLTDKNFAGFDEDKISYKSLTHNQIIEIYRNSKAVLDINHPGQNGLTMRTFETLGAGRKLITTNSTIKNYPFYNVNNILVIDREKPELTTAFFDGSFQGIDDEILFSMSLKGWLIELFTKENDIWKINS